MMFMALPDSIIHPSLPLVFGAVLVDQIGVPVPALPILLLAGAAAAEEGGSASTVALVAVTAALIADALWYLAGRKFGSRVLGVMCRLSLSPDSCVRQTEGVFQRYGLGILLVAKFVPGVAAVGTAMAGILRTSVLRFLLVDAGGAILWVVVWLGLGVLFSSAVEDVLTTLQSFGLNSFLGLVGLLAAWLLYRAARRQAFLRSLRMARIGVEDLWALMNSGEAPIILDVRSALQQATEGRIPGAQVWTGEGSELQGVDFSSDRDVVLYCACPNEASAARIAKQLKAAGFRRVRPLAGGIEAWRAAGYPVEAALAMD
jgi:membrane protein DedA with SNARE-associated domain/rhodanese-related sulfurtransferase